MAPPKLTQDNVLVFVELVANMHRMVSAFFEVIITPNERKKKATISTIISSREEKMKAKCTLAVICGIFFILCYRFFIVCLNV